MESSVPMWQAASLCGLMGWIIVSSMLGLTKRVRSLVQPWVTRRVVADVPLILRVQSLKHGFFDSVFSVLSCMVSVPFYTGFLPLIFWSGHSKLARQMTLLIAFCDYFGNAIKDLVSAPRPSCPPVRRVTATDGEKENAMEYGLPSSHALNTVCMAGYLLHYALTNNTKRDGTTIFVGITLVLLLIFVIGIARVYLGMHSVIDVIAGIIIGLAVLAFWIAIHGFIDNFVVSGQNVTAFWAGLSFLLCFAYPTPESPTPSFDYHAAFNGVAFGIVSGVQQTFLQFHHENVPRIFTTPEFSLLNFMGRMMVGIPTILLVKFCSKALSKWMLPITCNTLGIPIKSTSYVPALKEVGSNKDKLESKPLTSGYLQRLLAFIPQQLYDVDTGIRFFQYAGLAWSVVDLVPSIFFHFGL